MAFTFTMHTTYLLLEYIRTRTEAQNPEPHPTVYNRVSRFNIHLNGLVYSDIGLTHQSHSV